MIGNALIAVSTLAAILLAASGVRALRDVWRGWCTREDEKQRARVAEIRRQQIRLVDRPPSLWQQRRRPFDYDRD
jgi:hypothetical protein